MRGKIKNISLKTYRNFLKDQGCVCNRKKGGHEHWTREDLLRPITFQSHIDPIPEFILMNGLRILGMNKEGFIEWLSK